MDVDGLVRSSDWSGVRAAVVGLGGAGFAAADNLNHLGADVVVSAESATAAQLERAELLEVLGARVDIHAGATEALPDGVDVVVVDDAVGTDHPVIAQAAARGVPVWGELELAWRLRPAGPGGEPAPWLCVAGSRDVVLTATLATAILRAAGLRPVPAGAGLLPVVEAVMDPEPYDVYVLGLSADQLRRRSGIEPTSSALVSTVDADPADVPLLGQVFEGTRVACLFAEPDPDAEALLREADVVEGARAVPVRFGTPSVSMLGVVEDLVVDRAFIAERASSAAELVQLGELESIDSPGRPGDGVGRLRLVTAALLAAGLTRSLGVPQAAVQQGLLDAGA